MTPNSVVARPFKAALDRPMEEVSGAIVVVSVIRFVFDSQIGLLLALMAASCAVIVFSDWTQNAEALRIASSIRELEALFLLEDPRASHRRSR